MDIKLKKSFSTEKQIKYLEEFVEFGKFLTNTSNFKYGKQNQYYLLNLIKFAKKFYGVELNDVFSRVKNVSATFETSEFFENKNSKLGVGIITGKFIRPTKAEYVASKLKTLSFKDIKSFIDSKKFVVEHVDIKELENTKISHNKESVVDFLKDLRSLPIFGSTTYTPLQKEIQKMYSFITPEKFLTDSKLLAESALKSTEKVENSEEKQSFVNQIEKLALDAELLVRKESKEIK